MILLPAYNTLQGRTELTSLRLEVLTLYEVGRDLILLRQSKTDQTREGVLLALDTDASLAIRSWISLAAAGEGYRLRGFTGKLTIQVCWRT